MTLQAASYRTREEWLAARAADPTSIGASEAAACLGVSPWASPWDVYRRKMLAERNDATSEAMDRGNDWEPAVLNSYHRQTAHDLVTPAQVLGLPEGIATCWRDDASWLRVSPDAYARTAATGLGLVEAKTASRGDGWSPEQCVIERWDDAAAALVPPHYAVQAYVQAWVTGAPWVDLCALVSAFGWLQLRIVRLVADPVAMEGIVATLAEWRERHLVRCEEPPIDGSEACTAVLARRFHMPAPRPVRIATAEQAARMARFAALGEQAKVIETERESLKNALIAETLAGEKLALSGDKTAPYGQVQRAGATERIDLDKLRREHPEIAAACTVPHDQTVTFRTYRF